MLVLINGSPTKEFEIMRGVRQCDLMASFLFIIVMEGLHVSLEVACDLHYFQAFLFLIMVCLSHILYMSMI